MSEEKDTVSPAEEQKNEKNEQPEESKDKDVKENGTGDAAESEKEAPKEMRAVVLTGFGGLKSVKILKKPEPTANEGEVLIRVKAWYVFLFVFCIKESYFGNKVQPLHVAYVGKFLRLVKFYKVKEKLENFSIYINCRI